MFQTFTDIVNKVAYDIIHRRKELEKLWKQQNSPVSKLEQ